MHKLNPKTNTLYENLGPKSTLHLTLNLKLDLDQYVNDDAIDAVGMGA